MLPAISFGICLNIAHTMPTLYFSTVYSLKCCLVTSARLLLFNNTTHVSPQTNVFCSCICFILQIAITHGYCPFAAVIKKSHLVSFNRNQQTDNCIEATNGGQFQVSNKQSTKAVYSKFNCFFHKIN